MGSMPLKPDLELSPKVRALLRQEGQYIVGGVEPLPLFFERGEGAKVWDVDGKEYLDFIVGFSSVNQGHRHPYIMKKVMEQYEKIHLVNISAHNPLWPPFAEMMCKRFGYDKILSMISGTEAADTACKTARKWGITVKGIPVDKCLVLATGKSYHGMTSGVWNLQDPSKARTEYGLNSKIHMNVNPSTGEMLTYPVLDPMKRCIEEHHERIAAVIMEPYHGVTPDIHDEGRYARAVYDLCRKYNILFITDEVRSGVGKTGKFFSYMHMGDDCKPDMVTMGKSITGGMYPGSFVMGTDKVMKLVGSGESASTFAYNPIAIAAANAAIEVLDREHMMERAVELGDRWAKTIRGWNHPLIDWVSQIGAECNIFVKGVRSERLGALLMHKGLALFPVHPRLRVSIPFVMSDAELDAGLAIMKEALDTVHEYGQIEGETWHLPMSPK